MVRVVQCGASDVLAVVSGGAFVVEAHRGVPVDVPDHIAGRGPGPWVPAGPLLMDDGRQWRPAVEAGQWEARDPGSGLLAQEDVWRIATGSEG